MCRAGHVGMLAYISADVDDYHKPLPGALSVVTGVRAMFGVLRATWPTFLEPLSVRADAAFLVAGACLLLRCCFIRISWFNSAINTYTAGVSSSDSNLAARGRFKLGCVRGGVLQLMLGLSRFEIGIPCLLVVVVIARVIIFVVHIHMRGLHLPILLPILQLAICVV